MRDDAGVLKLAPFHSRDSPHPLHSSQINTNVLTVVWLLKPGIERLACRPVTSPMALAASADECHLLACLILQLLVAPLVKENICYHTRSLAPASLRIARSLRWLLISEDGAKVRRNK